MAEGKAKFAGDRKVFEQLKSTLTTFTPDFQLMPGTKAKITPPAKPSKDLFEAPPIANSDGAQRKSSSIGIRKMGSSEPIYF